MLPTNFWTADKTALLGTASDQAIAKRLGISASAVLKQRRVLGITSHLGDGPKCKWGQTELGLLSNFTDKEIAKLTGRSLKEIADKRREC